MEEKKKQNLYRMIMLIIVVALITFIVTTVLTYNGSIRYVVSSKDQPSNHLTKKIDMLLGTVTQLINEKYIGDVNEEELIDGALRGLVESVGDTYTEYYSKEELEKFKAQTLGNFVGIGIYMKANLEKDVTEIIETIENSPAREAGLEPGDEILKVNGTEYKAKDLDKLSADIKGEENTKVTLTIKRGEETFDIEITRKSVHVNYVENEMLENDIGYIGISTFDQGCAVDFEKAYDELASKGAKALIIDIRSNGGGVVDEALEIADLICDKNETLLITVDKEGKEEVRRAKKDAKITMPVVVLTNRSSASASEILVAALKENEKAKVVGDTTFGKGVIQELIPLSNGGALKVTSSEYYTPNKNKIHEVGVEPDYQVSYDYKTPEVDEQLNKAIEILKEN